MNSIVAFSLFNFQTIFVYLYETTYFCMINNSQQNEHYNNNKL